ncbi:MAG: hypothetical protein ACXU85_11670 [Xanthobacteraceae bacterium]
MPAPLPLTGNSSSGTPGLLVAIAFNWCTPLLAATALAWWNPASAQAMTPGLQQSSGIATLPLVLGTVPPVGIPLGSTEIVTPGISPAAPLSGAGSILGNTGCSGFTNLSQFSGAPFDGGGISGGASTSCAPWPNKTTETFRNGSGAGPPATCLTGRDAQATRQSNRNELIPTVALV